MAKHAGGRPVSVWTPQKIASVIKQMEAYTTETDLPILAEFAYTHDYDRAQLYGFPKIAHTIKKMMLKKETELEKIAIKGDAPTAFCIFSLKQLGWSDKQQIEHSGEVAGSSFTFVEAPKNSGNTDT